MPSDVARTNEEISMARPVAAVRRPVHPFFIGLGSALLMAALFTDCMYISNSLMQWANFSAWLITGGLVLALVSVIVLVIEVALHRFHLIRRFDFVLVAVAAVLSLINVFVHTRDAWTSVVPSGVALSLIVTIILFIVGLRGWCVATIGDAERGRNP